MDDHSNQEELQRLIDGPNGAEDKEGDEEDKGTGMEVR